ncbi:MAG: RNase adapter RapZ [Deltaproteobacteria bacterium]|nr:RNase adapter RapZ [Deltaproteobacteria bacterium]
MVTKKQKPKFVAGAPLVIITGLSGAGKSTAMHFLEDLGCYCLDNLPPSLIPDFFNLYEQGGALGTGVVVASDVRSGALFNDFAATVRSLEESGTDFMVLYLDCGTETLIRRFKEVRRNHPLQTAQPMEEAIEDERARLEPIRAIANLTIDTSRLDAANLREALLTNLVAADMSDVVQLTFLSFGFKHGIPRDVDFVFDVRFLPNPHYVPELRPKTGEDKAVYAYVMSESIADDFFEKTASLIDLTLESFVKVGKTSLTVGVGCTGGRHRSVAFARRLADHFDDHGKQSLAVHRDISKPHG